MLPLAEAQEKVTLSFHKADYVRTI
jgi:hypothetical protein